MPVEIRELTIRVTVNDEQGKGKPPAGSSNEPNDSDTKQAIVKEAVEQVMHILNNKNER